MAAFTNTVDLFCTFLEHFFKSFARNMRPIFNLLGEYGVMGKHREYQDDRNTALRVIFGLISAPFVAATALLTNSVDGFLAFMKNFCLSFGRNLRVIFNLLGEHGVMGPRRVYEDDRDMPAKVVYGIISAPFVGLTAILTNLVDALCAYFKNYENTIKKPFMLITGVTVGSLAAPFAFVLRKAIKGLYNFTLRPFLDCQKDKPFNGSRMLKGILNFLTLGLYSAFKKIFKGLTGYTDRFGFPGDNEASANGLDQYTQVQNTFRDAINLASKGKFPDVKDKIGRIRPLARIFYGLRHKVEGILKTMHDAYLDYAKELQDEKVERTEARYNMFNFFQSAQFKQAEGEIQSDLKAEQERSLTGAEAYLLPASPAPAM
jgi:hypothetical protein